MLICLQKYNFTIQYRPSKDIVLADFSPAKKISPLNYNMQDIHFSNDRLNMIRGAIECDPKHETVYCSSLTGWPDCPHQVPRMSWHSLWYGRWVFHRRWPTCKKKQSLHTARIIWQDPNISMWQPPRHWKMQLIARATVYWPGIDTDITDYIKDATYVPSSRQHNLWYPETSPMAHGKTLLATSSVSMARNTSS